MRQRNERDAEGFDTGAGESMAMVNSGRTRSPRRDRLCRSKWRPAGGDAGGQGRGEDLGGARDLADGAQVLKMFGEYVPVRAAVADVPHFSAHADAAQIIDWLRGAPAPHATYLVHGEPEAAAALRDRIDRTLGWTAAVPRSGERVLVR
ncbi:hypothetical protein OG426_01290 [Streptomyces canus]|uniref:MBL fold metallo-hydrolase RNA specificity domain-containing protein n=1 Tax=Streptomyces canus TaxID=58343 RepID=UPI00386A5538|nr:hypothetical protein OG426_01290 [Streptomyces canus]